ncbi:MAG: FtsX-like permease family protein [Acidobacteria bacterium]|nr:FtsX-like permease family protein [Acidobacteriota bacterium]
MSNLWRRIQVFLNRKKIQRELEEEMAAHRAEMADPRTFGSTLKLREDSNDAWGFGWFDRLWQDVDYAVRLLRRSPAFTLTAFGFVNTALFRPLPGIEDPHALMRLTRQAPGVSSTNTSYPSYDFYRRNNKVFSQMFATTEAELTYNATLGVRPAYGTLTPSAPGDISISTAFLNSRFAGDKSILNKPILLNNKAARIIDVVEDSFVGLNPDPTKFWAIIDDHPHFFKGSILLTSIDNDPVFLYGRLAPGISPDAAEQAMRPIVDERRKVAPKEIWKDEFLLVAPAAYAVAKHEKVLLPFLLAGGLLLLVLATACANLGNLLLARSVTREREFAIRNAIGATRTRVIRQLMTESLILALLGAAVGLALSSAASSFLIKQLDGRPASTPPPIGASSSSPSSPLSSLLSSSASHPPCKSPAIIRGAPAASASSSSPSRPPPVASSSSLPASSREASTAAFQKSPASLTNTPSRLTQACKA